MTRPDQPPAAPDPTPDPDRDPWEEYRAAAQSLGAVRREAAAVDADATRVASGARAALAEISAQLAGQQARLTAEAGRLGIRPPQLTPTGAERAAAEATLAGDPAAVPEALADCRALLAEADAELAGGRGWWPPARWLLIATPVAVAVAVVLLLLLLA